MQKIGREKEMAWVEALETQVMETLDQEMLEVKAQVKQATKREQESLKIAPEEAIKSIAPTRAT